MWQGLAGMPARKPKPMITPAAPRAAVREEQWVLLQRHYLEHQSGPLVMLGEELTTQQCFDCRRYADAWDAHQRNASAEDILLKIFSAAPYLPPTP